MQICAPYSHYFSFFYEYTQNIKIMRFLVGAFCGHFSCVNIPIMYIYSLLAIWIFLTSIQASFPNLTFSVPLHATWMAIFSYTSDENSIFYIVIMIVILKKQLLLGVVKLRFKPKTKCNVKI